MTWLMENPTAIIVGGVMAELFLLAMPIREGRGGFFSATFLVAIATCLLLIAQKVVVTDEEAMRSTLESVAKALSKNDLDEVMSYIDPQAKEFRERISSHFPDFVYSDVHVAGDVEFDHQPEADPPRAAMGIWARCRLTNPSGGVTALGGGELIERVVFYFEKRGNRWLIVDFTGIERPL
jgi:hypothetical protein